MFHHFHNEIHLRAQGSLDSDSFNQMLDWLSERNNLIGANEYLKKFNSNSLSPGDICLSFDDALLCQYDIAFPVLSDRKIDSFFFVYSSVFTGEPDNLEIYRYFRCNCFESIDEFYERFFDIFKNNYSDEYFEHKSYFSQLNYLQNFPFYTENDRWFRYIRDQILKDERYEMLMQNMMAAFNFNLESTINKLWIKEGALKEIASQGHLIGLHSFSHPTQMSRLSYDLQMKEYKKNMEHLENLVGDVVSMSHPCGDYNNDTLKVLSELGIQIGFRSCLTPTYIKSKLEIPRDDHANVFKAMNQ
jgi:peptidoglycan/xylan/chitin deacetylase (PgdA/CDA1 family)